jgi:thioredoxin 1
MKNFRGLITYLLLFTLCACAKEKKNGGGLLDVTAFEEKINSIADHTLIDVRTAEEVAEGFIPGARFIDFYDADFTKKASELDKTKPVFVYCKGGGRSAQAADQLRQLGFMEVYDLKGGFMSWENAGKKVETANAAEKTEQLSLAYHIYNKAQFDSTMKSATPVLIDFYAKWCQPCKRMAPVLEKLRTEYAGKISIIKIDVDNAKELSKELKIEGLPVVRTYKNGKALADKTGFQDETELRKMIEELLK